MVDRPECVLQDRECYDWVVQYNFILVDSAKPRTMITLPSLINCILDLPRGIIVILYLGKLV